MLPASCSPLPRWQLNALRILAWLPPVVLVLMAWPLRVGVPYYDSWAFVEQYRQWQQGHYGWRELFTLHNMHPVVPGKLAFWAVMQWLRGDTGWLPVLSWLQSLVIALGVHGVLRPLRQGHPVRGALLMLAANGLIFNAGQGGTWIWDFVFLNFIPGCCLMVSLWTLSQPWSLLSRLLLAGTACLVAALGFGSGFIAGWLMLPMVALTVHRENPGRVKLVTLGWAILCVALMVMVFVGMGRGPSHEAAIPFGERAGSLLGRPLMTMTYVLVLLGGSLGHGTSADPLVLCALAGAVSVIVVAWALVQLWLQRQRVGLWLAAWPWLACCAWGAVNACSITLARMHASYVLAFSPRYLTFTLFFPLGAVMLVATVLWYGREAAAIPRPRWMPVAVTLLLGLLMLNWVDGRGQMLWFHQTLCQQRTALAFAKALPLTPHRILEPNGEGTVAPLALYLQAQNKLRGVEMVANAELSSVRVASAVSSHNSHFDSLSYDADGLLTARGTYAGGQRIGEFTDVILITAKSPGVTEHFIALGTPTVPDDYFNDAQRRIDYAEHYHGWKVPLDQLPVPTARGTVIQAYGFDGSHARLIPGEFPLPAARP